MTPDAAAVVMLVAVSLVIVGLAIVRARPEDIPAIIQALARLGRKLPATGGQPEPPNTWSNMCSTSWMADPVAQRIPAGVMLASPRHEPVYRRAEIWCADRTWLPCAMLAWARCQGGWAALLELPDGQEGWYLYASNVIRKATG